MVSHSPVWWWHHLRLSPAAPLSRLYFPRFLPCWQQDSCTQRCLPFSSPSTLILPDWVLQVGWATGKAQELLVAVEFPLSLKAVGLAESSLQVLSDETSRSERCAGGMAHETPLHPSGAGRAPQRLLKLPGWWRNTEELFESSVNSKWGTVALL